MKSQPVPDNAPTKKPPEGQLSMKEIWDAAAKEFEAICGESLQRGQIKSFEDVQKKIKSANQISNGADEEQNVKWEKAKSVGLQSLKYLKMLVGAASQASSFIPIPEAAANITGSALCFVFDIPETIKGYNDAINQVFSEVSSALSQFHIYQTIDNADPLLIQQIHLVLVSFVKVCAYVVKYRQGRKRDRFLKQFKSVFDDDSGLADQMAEFRSALQQQRDVEGTVTLAVVVETKQDIALLLEQSIVFGNIVQETHQAVQETQKGVQALRDDVDRMRTLIKIRDTLGVPSTVRLDTNTTQTCNDIADRCLSGMGSWLWTHEAYTAWTTTKDRDKDAQRLLIVSGPPSSGKTCATALITKRLEEQKGRTYVAHYFFPSSTKKADSEKNSIQSALKYMAFQIARVDVAAQKVLGKACEEEPSAFRRSGSLDTLDSLWEKLKIGASGSNAVYYLVFDGIENLPDQQVKMLLDFVFSPRMTKESSERVQILLSGTDDQFANWQESRNSLKIQMEKHNTPDMRIVIEEALNQRGMLQNTKPDSDQQRARDKILDKLPQNVEGSYSRLQFGLDDVMRLLSTRTAMRELDRMLDQSMSSHEAAIKNLQRTLTADEISELNELLKWVLFSNDTMTLEKLEAAMFLYSGTESLASLEYIIKNKYSAVLKLDDGCVFGQDGVKEYLRKDIDSSGRASNTKDRATISMTITINNVDQELCGHFLWDLAHKAIRDKFNFNLDGDASNALHGGRGTIAVDEFEAHHTIVTRAFEYLSKPPKEQTENIGPYLVTWLPFHLSRLRQLEDDDQGSLMPSEQSEIGQNLYKLFKNDEVFLRHKESFQDAWWIVSEIEDLQKWLMDSAIMRRLDKRWRDEVQLAASPTRGYLKELVRVIIQGFLRERSWNIYSACQWLLQLMKADERKLEVHTETPDDNVDAFAEIDWNRMSTWCQGILGLPDLELNSLWYERLATAATDDRVAPEAAISLYQRAIEEKNPSWLCYQGLGTAFSRQNRTSEAVTQVELALKSAQQEDATPKPETKDIVGLYLLLGQYAYEAGDVRNADKYYSLACEGGDESQVRDGQLGRLKSRLGFPNTEAIQALKTTFAQENGKAEMAAAMEMIALDSDHNDLIARMFAVLKQDPDLLKEVLDAMEKAIWNLTPGNGSKVLTGDERFAEDEARSVLLCDRGFAAYLFKVSSDGLKSVNEALRLWEESRDLLANVGGTNALFTRQRATTALAAHYFQSIAEGLQLNYYDALAKLTKLANSDSDYNFYRSDAIGFLGSAHVLCGKKESAKEVLMARIKQGLQILSDDILENDKIGFSILQTALEQYQDFRNAVVALSLLGQPDLVTEALYFDVGDITEVDDERKLQAFDVVSELAKEVIRVINSQIPETKLQSQRIEAAKLYIDTLIATAEAKTEVNGNSEDEKPRVSDLTAYAHRLLQSRILPLHKAHTPSVDKGQLSWSWSCDGRTSDGRECDSWNSFEDDLYHCIYCSNKDFCGNCFKRLRNPESGVDFMECSAKHRWLQIPHQGNSMYVSMKANNVRVPIDVRPLDGDDRILKAYYVEDGSGEEITIDEWKERVATEWGISLKTLSETSSEDGKS
ncbi:hypothetical protein M431DRAFT_523482 [Trichoderma harzianum CBS 226.95]|uniref:Uncharacterized protein n=1 Tax=Trichoderma harzianum CBS 226.95 TaxID=983964 RepID=A0A2T4A147_TRIHA|nr:hypothetical protein M431DRAFT_523482 [Trichoderma harzianum CBS 226.95]PTB50785.1 hypothetical protein M431DRAFT_523482 [Trichoderma harzianum CBS 226.95]